jgi:serpin B
MLTRREFVLALAGAAMATGALAGCGERPPAAVAGPAVVGRGRQAKSKVRRAAADPAAAAVAAGVVREFTADLYRQLSGSAGNLVCSPYSVAVALAMTRNGARSKTAAQMDHVLHAPDVRRLNAGLGTLESLLERRSGPVRRADGSPAEVTVRVANSLWGQQDLAWQTAFLDALARHYGAGMRLVDYRADAAAARSQINAWTSEQTRGKIDQLIPEGALTALTRLVLVNAVYLKAPWEQPFRPGTRPRLFTRADGSTVQAPTMATEITGTRHGRADGWQAVELRYAGNDLAMTVILPDRGTLQAFEKQLDGDRLAQILQSLPPVEAVDLWLPKWTFRTSASMKDTLTELGMPTAFDDELADFSGMTAQEKLFITAVLHEAYIAVDESGTEAAAATAVVAGVTAGRVTTPVTMVVDRPFLFVIHDLATATPLFIGRVTDPTSEGAR